MIKRLFTGLVLSLGIVFLVGCNSLDESVVIKRFSLDTLDALLLKENVEIDKNISSDGNGSLKITANEPVKLSLFEIKNLDVDNANLIYRAKVRTEDLEGDVYLEMWCTVNDKGPFFSRSLVPPAEKNQAWQVEETPFLLEKGQKPGLVALCIEVKGTGIIWIDDIELVKVPI